MGALKCIAKTVARQYVVGKAVEAGVGVMASIFGGAEQAAPPPPERKAASTVSHQVKHSSFIAALAGVVVGALLSAAVGAAALFFTGATGGLGLAVVIGATLAASKRIGQASSWVTDAINSLFPADDGPVVTGSPNVFIKKLAAARAGADEVGCLKHGGPSPIAQGSDTVFVNGAPLARIDDLVVCGAPLKQGEATVLVGGGKATELDVESEFSLLERGVLIAVEFLVPPSKCMRQGLRKLPGMLVRGGKSLAGLAARSGQAIVRGLRHGAKLAGQAMQAARKKLANVIKSIKAGACATKPDKGKTNTGSKKGNTASDPKCQKGCPVDTSTGAVVEQRIDLELGSSFPFRIRRSYDSQRDRSGLLGRGWCDSLSESLTLGFDGELIEFHAWDGTIVPFDMAPGTNRVFNRRHANYTLIRSTEGFLVHDRRDDSTRNFATQGDRAHLVGHHDAHGNGVTLQYNGKTLARVVHSDGPSVTIRHVVVPDHERTMMVVIERLDGGLPSAVARYTLEDGLLTNAESNTSGRLNYEYDARGRLARWSDTDKTWARYEYDHEDRCVRSRAAGGLYCIDLEYDDTQHSVTVKDSRRRPTELRFNDDAQLVEEIDPLGNSTRYKYDRHGDLVGIVDPMGNAERFVSDPVSGVLVRHIDAEGHRTEFFYDDDLRMIGLTDALGNTWAYERGPRGEVSRAEGPDGSWYAYEYSTGGQLLSVARSDGAKRELAYDQRKRLTSETDWKGNTHRYEYDMWGRLVGATDARGSRQQLLYDPRDLLVGVRHSDGSELRIEYDGSRKLSAFIDENGNASRKTYGAFDVVQSQSDAEGRKYEWTYDPDYAAPIAVRAPDGRSYRLERDAAGRIIKEIDYGGRTTQYELDESGNRTAQINAAGERTNYVYDRNGRLVEIEADDEVTTYEYDPLGRLVFAENATGRYEWEYDAIGRCTRSVQNGDEIRYRYGERGECIERILGADSWQKAEHRTCFEHDENGALTALTLAEESLAVQRDAAGYPSVIRASGCTVEQRYNDRGGLVEQRLLSDSSGGLTVVRRSYAYDPANNLTDVEDSRWGTTHYQHDRSGRILSATRDGEQSEAFAYRPIGLVSEHQRPASLGSERLVVELDEGGLPSRAGDTEYEYDAVGRMVRKTMRRRGFREQTWSFRWDARDRLIEAKTPKGQIWRYAYDPLGRRVTKFNPSTRESVHFTWDGDVLLRELHLRAKAPGAMEQVVRTVHWHHEPGTFRPIAREVDGETQVVICDPIGAPVAIARCDGELAWRGQRSVWGTELRRSQIHDRDGNAIGFPGQYWDSETGLFYNRFRYYEPALGQYISPDPIGLEGGPQLRAYVHNPNTWSDPLGLTGCGGTDGQAAGGGGGGGKPLLPDSYWINKQALKQVTPGTRTVNQPAKPSSKGGTYHSTTHYDAYGRQIGQTHRTHHGYSNPKGEHYHPNPHHHRRNPSTGEKLKDPRTGSRTWPGLFGN